MTEREVEQMAQRLVRVWKNARIVRAGLYNVGHTNEGFGALLSMPSLFLKLQVHFDQLGMRFRLWADDLAEITGYLYCENDFIFNPSPPSSFATQWLPFFRRGCWLSGCPIEASAHEKAEWIQGFTREELQAWNLKT